MVNKQEIESKQRLSGMLEPHAKRAADALADNATAEDRPGRLKNWATAVRPDQEPVVDVAFILDYLDTKAYAFEMPKKRRTLFDAIKRLGFERREHMASLIRNLSYGVLVDGDPGRTAKTDMPDTLDSMLELLGLSRGDNRLAGLVDYLRAELEPAKAAARVQQKEIAEEVAMMAGDVEVKNPTKSEHRPRADRAL